MMLIVDTLPSIRCEGMIDFVSQCGTIVGNTPTVFGNVQDLLLLLIQTNFVRVVLPVVEGLSKEGEEVDECQERITDGN